MPYIQLDDKQFPLRAGEARIGGGAAEIPIPGVGASSVLAVVETSGDEAVIRRALTNGGGAPAPDIRVNGVRLGAEPIPLLHGDRIEAGGAELLFGDERGASNTQSISADEVRSRLTEAGPGNGSRRPTRRTAATGGRLVSLVDGREYAIPSEGITIGRDAGCDVVVPTGDVSRRHAMIAPGADGYTLRDTSTNGVFVNEERVAVVRVLGRGDVLQVGDAQFRFYADEAVPEEAGRRPGAETPPAPAAPAARAAPAAVSAPAGLRSSPAEMPPPPAPTTAAAQAASNAVTDEHSTEVPDTRPVLATLEIINQGMLRGRKFAIRTPLAHLGRGPHNDVVIPDESVSDTHAKLQKREAGWYVVDMNSTNGTYVAGTRIDGEQRLVGAVDVRFGGVKMIFQSAGPADAEPVGTRAIARHRLGLPPETVPDARIAAGAGRGSVREEPEPGRAAARWGLVAVLAALAGFVLVYLLRQGR